MLRLAEAIEKAEIDLVPKILIGADGAHAGDGAGLGGGNVLQSLLALLPADKAGVEVASPPPAVRPEA